MDDALVARWKQGEGAAATAVRNALRTSAERVLSNPALRAAEGSGGRILVENEERRRELTAAVAKEVMAHGGDSAATLTALTLMSAARHAVVAMRVGRPMAGSAHLPPPVAVGLALTPEAMPQAQRDAYQRHLESCSGCSEDCRLVREIVRSAATAAPDATPAELDQAVHDSADDAMAAAAAAALAEMESAEAATATRTAPARPEGRRPALARPAFRPSRADPEKRRFELRTWLPLLLIVAVGAWWWWSRRDAARMKEVDPSIAALAVRDAPKVGAGEDVPDYAKAGVTLLGRGDCRSAAAAFRTARRAHPEDRRLWVLEGGSFVCAGDGPGAMQTLDVLSRDKDATPAARWFYAQALLLNGSVGPAEDALGAVAASKSPYAEKAREQLNRVRAVAP